MNLLTNFSSAGFSTLLNVRLYDLVFYLYGFGNQHSYNYISRSCKTLSKSLWVERVSDEKGPK